MKTDAFASKAAGYARYRADYPPHVVDSIAQRARLSTSAAVVDLGSGTGLLSKHLLPRVGRLYGVEPSADMRRLAEALFISDSRFRSVTGSAEATQLPDACADAIVCGNAFHYFDPVQTRREARRILRGRGAVVIALHAAPDTPSAFMRDYLDFIASVTPRELGEAHSTTRDLRQWSVFFDADPFETVDLGETIYPLRWDTLRGRFASTSVAPLASAPEHTAVFDRLHAVFSRHQVGGAVQFALRWQVVAGEIDHEST